MKINTDGLTRQEIQDTINSLKEQLKSSKQLKDLIKGDEYWFIASNGTINRCDFYGDSDDYDTISNGNAFLTEEETEIELKKRRYIVKINDRINELSKSGKIKDYYFRLYLETNYREIKCFNSVSNVSYPCYFHKIISEGVCNALINEFEEEIRFVLEH